MSFAAVPGHMAKPARKDTHMPETTTDTLEVPGVNLVYDVRAADGGNGGPPLMLIGSPMDASGFGTLAARFPDRTVMTYDPRGTARSEKTDAPTRVDARAARRRHPPASRGARRRPGRPVRHERRRRQRARARRRAPGGRPHAGRARAAAAPTCCPTASAALAATEDIRDTYQSDGLRPGDGEVHRARRPRGPGARRLRRAGPPRPGDVRAARPRTTARATMRCVGQNIITLHPLRAGLRRARARPRRKIVVGIGRGVRGPDGTPRRRGRRRAARAATAVVFPGGHGGFLGDEYGQPGDPDGFASKLREVLA